MGELLAYKEELKDKDMVIALNKIDQLLPDEREERVALLKQQFPDQEFILLSGLTGEGVDALYDLFKSKLSE